MSKLPNIKTDFPAWYQDVVYRSELVDQSPVRGSMVVRPYGTALWENITAILDKKIKDTGHQNAIFPLLIPLSFIKKEAEHIEGFAPELAIVTHAGGKELEEPYVIRPTSETIIHHMFARWIKSWRDLPLKLNQWANVMRWEMRTRPFLRTSEFFWQEGHTAHETLKEANEEVQMMLNEYVDLAQNYLAIPVITGAKSESEKFAGGEATYTFEGIMQDGRALQMGTSHLLSQNFAKAFGIQFQDRDGVLQYPYLTSWGATTRLIGALVMTHGDQKGLIIPPKVAPIQVVVVPIVKKESDATELIKTVHALKQHLKQAGIAVVIDDDRAQTPGAKFYKWELKGVPLRVELGPRDLAAGQIVVVDRLGMDKLVIPLDNAVKEVQNRLDTIQKELFLRAQKRLSLLIKDGDKLTAFGPTVAAEAVAYMTGWCQDAVCEERLKTYKASIRCIVNDNTKKECFHCRKPSKGNVLVAKAY